MGKMITNILENANLNFNKIIFSKEIYMKKIKNWGDGISAMLSPVIKFS